MTPLKKLYAFAVNDRLTNRLRTVYRTTFGNVRGTLEGLLPEISLVRREISRVSAEMEKRFLKCASLLDILTGNSESLVSDSELLVALATGRDGGESMISETVRVMEGPMSFLDRWRTAMGEHLSELREASGIVMHLCEAESTLSRLFVPLRHAQTMFRVESARLPEEARSVFAALTEEIGSVHAQVGEGFREQFRILAKTHDTIDQVTATMSAESARVGEAVGAKKEQIRTNLEKLTGEIVRNSGREVQFSATSQVVAQQVISVVMSLQMHDIATQRLGNISSGLQKAEGIVGEVQGARRFDASDEAAHKTADLLRIQAAQMTATVARIHESEVGVQTAVGTILASVDALGEECLELKEFAEVTVAANGTIQILLDMVDDARRLTRSSIAAAENAKDLVMPIQSLARALTGTVQRLAHEMLLIALNAQLQAVQIGNGTGLEVLAAFTADISARTSAVAEEISQKMDRLGLALQRITTGLEEIARDGDTNLQFLETEGTAQEQRLHGLRDCTLNELLKVCERADLIGGAANDLGAEVSGQEWAIGPLTRASALLSELDSRILDVVPERPREFSVGIEHEQKYTMAAERETHRAVLLGQDTEASVAQEIPAEEFSVELF